MREDVPIHKVATKDPAGQTLYRTLSFHIHGEGENILTVMGIKPGRSDYFPEGTGCLKWHNFDSK